MATNRPEVPDASRTTSALLRSPEAAERLAISPRKLWALTASGDVPCVRIGRNVRYVDAHLDDYVAAQTRGGRS
ncbi:Helix-turn-helix domain protein [Planctomycetes bacterium MalM25]|nr:Helix-turn-helix domain protein [Planctomycetes bacterium MalM25]